MSDQRRLNPIARRFLVALAVMTAAGAGFVALVFAPIPLYPHHRSFGRVSV